MATIGKSLTGVFFALAYNEQQGIPQDTPGVPSHYYMLKSGYFLSYFPFLISKI